jgi:PAS domain S-box-containing protein
MIIKPILILKSSIEKIGSGKFEIIPVKSTGDEIESLYTTFNLTILDLEKERLKTKNYNQDLEEQVKQKTVLLKNTLLSVGQDKEDLEKQKLATLNILEDISESEKILKEMNRSLDKRSVELSSLKSLSDDLANIIDVEESVKTINKYLNQVLDFAVITYVLINPFDERSLIYKSFLKKEVSEKFIRDVENIIKKYILERNEDQITSADKVIENIRPQIMGEKLNNKSKLKIEKDLFFPMHIGDHRLGFIHIAIDDKKLYKEDIKKLIEAMITSFSFSINHFYTLISAQHSKTVSLVESLSDGVIMFNNNKEIILTNPAVSKYTGLSREYFNFNDFFRLFPNVILGLMIDQAITAGTFENIDEVQLLNKFYEMKITPVKDSQKKIVGGAIIIHDITHIKQIDRMKTEFVSVASHQLRTPLTAIKLFTEMLMKGEVGDLLKEQKEYLDNIYQSTDRMVKLVNDLLNVTRIESGRLKIDPQPTNLSEFIKSIIAEAGPIAAIKKISINFKKDKGDMPEIAIDRNLIQQVIHNLLTNAIRYTPVGKNTVDIVLKKDKENYTISVSDQGIGIPPEAQVRMFEKFFRADNAVKTETEGTGLGLYVCKMIVESSGGKIWFESKKDHGTTFYVSLPIKGMVRKEGDRGLAIS